MNKLKFEVYLREKLAVLKQSEIDEIINEYLQHIDMRTAEGASEEEAINDFGDLNILVTEILDAYKIDPNHNQYEDFSQTVKSWLNKALDYINKIANSIMNRSGREMVSLIVEFALVIFMLIGISLVLDMIFNNFANMFYGFNFVTRFIRLLARVFKNLLNITLSLVILYWFANERIMKYKSKDLANQTREKTKPNVRVSKDIKNPNIKQADTQDNLGLNDNESEATKINSIQSEKAILQSQVKERSFGQMLFDGNLFVIRGIMFVILIPIIVVGVFLGITFVTIVYNTIIGSGSLGISVTLSGVLLIYFYILISMTKFVSGGK